MAEKNQTKTIFNGVMIGYTVLLLHILLILTLGIAVVLIKGIYDFRWLILIGGLTLVGISGYIFYKRFKDGKRSLSEAMNDPNLRDRTLEISLFGGMASVKLGHRDDSTRLIDATDYQAPRQLEAPKTTQIQELGELAKLLENDLISREEFSQLKEKIVRPTTE